MTFSTGWEWTFEGKVAVFRINGKRVTKAEYEAALPKKLGLSGRGLVKSRKGTPASLAKLGKAGWPLESEALAVHPTQVADMDARCRKEGVPTEFNPATGAPILTSKAHRKAYLRMEKCHDRNSFFGD